MFVVIVVAVKFVLDQYTYYVCLCFRYKISLLKPSVKALMLSTRISLRTDNRGFLSMQYMIKTDDGQVCFVEYFVSCSIYFTCFSRYKYVYIHATSNMRFRSTCKCINVTNLFYFLACVVLFACSVHQTRK